MNIDRRRLIEAATAKALREMEEKRQNNLKNAKSVGNAVPPKKGCGCKDKNLKEEIDPVPTPGPGSSAMTDSPLRTLSPKERAARQYARMTGGRDIEAGQEGF